MSGQPGHNRCPECGWFGSPVVDTTRSFMCQNVGCGHIFTAPRAVAKRIDAAIGAPHECDCERARREEREAVASYLRRVGEYGFEDIVARIERGEHR